KGLVLMARNYLMTWVSSTCRWAKWYRGKNYAVSCDQLGCPRTKEGSWRQANEWWNRKQAEITAREPAPAPHPHQSALNDLACKLEWAALHAPDEAAQLRAVAQEVERRIRHCCWGVWRKNRPRMICSRSQKT